MNPAWLRLFWWSSVGYRKDMLGGSVGLLVAAAFSVSVSMVALSVEQAVKPLLVEGGAWLRVRPASLHLGPVDVLGGLLRPKRVDADALKRLSQHPGVADGWPELWSRFPVGLSGSILGQGLYSDGALLGVPDAAVRRELRKPFHWKPGEVVPVLAPLSLFAVYNGSFAPANGFPRLSPSSVVGLRFTLVAGQSSFGSLPSGPLRLEAELVGLTRYGDALAALVPLETVEYLEQQLGVAEAGTWSSILLTLTPGADAETLRETIRSQGFVVEEVGTALRQLELALRTLRQGALGASAVGVGLALLVLLQVSRLLLRERQGSLRALWALGMPKRLLENLLRLEQLVLVLGMLGLGSLLGGALGMSLLPWVAARVRLGTGLELLSEGPIWPWEVLGAMGLLAPLVVWLGTRRALMPDWVSWDGTKE